eukprot:2508301-Alexandrium_andersonii.AAC.1
MEALTPLTLALAAAAIRWRGRGFRLAALTFALAQALEQRMQGLHLLRTQLLPTVRLFGHERPDLHANRGSRRGLSRQGT